MDRFQGLDTLMSANGITDAKTFDAYWTEVFSKRESQGENFAGFEWDTPQIDFTYEQLIAEAKVEVMASYVDLNSPALPSGNEVKLQTVSGSIPRMKWAAVRGENDLRKQEIALNEFKAVAKFTNKSESMAVRSYIAKALFDVLDEAPSSFRNSMNYQIGQMKSVASLTLDDNNNPRGSIRATFTAQVPAANFMAKKWWKSDGSAQGDPITDIRNFIRELRWKANGYQNATVELSEKYLYKLLAHDAVLTAIGYSMTGLGLRYTPANNANALAVAKGASLDAQRAAFKVLIECDELLTSKTQCGVRKLSTTTKKYEDKLLDAFADNTILVRPSGIIGKIKNVVPLRPDGQAIVAGIYGGRGILEYRYNRETRAQHWDAELTALAVPIRPYDMYYFTDPVEGYTAVSSPSGNPKSQGWYELSGSEYVLTDDTTVTEGKTYYTKD